MLTLEAVERLKTYLQPVLAELPSEACRLFHGRGRCWPGLEQLTVDWLQGILLVSLFRDPEEEGQLALVECLMGLTQQMPQPPQALLLQHRYRRDQHTDILFGDGVVEDWLIEEQGLRYLLTLGRNQNTGLFLDMAEGRRWVREQAQDCRVLNLFAYTCGFSVAAMAGGAKSVVNLDMSRGALSRGRKNHRLNAQAVHSVSFFAHDLFNSWGKLRRLGPYELIILDPPSFQKGSFDLRRDYPKMIRRLPGLLSPGGMVLACVNDPSIPSGFLIELMQQDAPELRFVRRLDNPSAFVDADPEGGLKALVFALDC